VLGVVVLRAITLHLNVMIVVMLSGVLLTVIRPTVVAPPFFPGRKLKNMVHFDIIARIQFIILSIFFLVAI
jgi:hypothetical protein